MFTKYEKTIHQIKTTILNSETLRKLVFYNTADALSKITPTIAEAAVSIYTKPVIYVYDDSPEFGISCFISITYEEGILLDGSIESSIKVSIACDRQVWDLNDSRIRPLAIASEVANALDGTKFDAAGRLKIRVLRNVYFSNELPGFVVLFDINDDKGDVVNDF